MTSHTIFVVATLAFHFIFVSTLDIKRIARIALSTESHADDNTQNDICSSCEADSSVSWGVKCTFATTCGLCDHCKADEPEDERIENSEEKGQTPKREEEDEDEDGEEGEKLENKGADDNIETPEKEDEEEEQERDEEEELEEKAAPLATHETNDKDLETPEKDEEDKPEKKMPILAKHTPKGGEEKPEKTYKGDEHTIEKPGKTHKGDEKINRMSKRCQGGDGEMYENGASECKKGKAWYCVDGAWKRVGECDKAQEDTAGKSKKDDERQKSGKDKKREELTDDAPQKAETLAKETRAEAKAPVLGRGIAEGCSRGHDCGYTSGSVNDAVRVPCPGGDKWMSPNAVVIRGRKGTSAIYCSVPKIGTSYTYGVMEDLKLPVKAGGRNAGYEAVGSILKENGTSKVEELCRAHSFIIIRNPWDRVVSAYVDKVLTREVFKEPPSFNHFMQQLDKIEHPETINQHFRPVSELCHTSGKNAVVYDEKIKIEDDLRHHLEKVFITKLKLPPSNVHKVLDEWETKKHPTTSGRRWGDIDFSLNSEQSRVMYYFSQSDRNLARRVYGDDIKFGAYQYDPK